eukprot:TRINITY_DN36645_c0_g1_i1.p1 TRINITY_DN36645_c0_g1~~TRINITY_DN36645_c0_g1_i1.p1  ORF type:complete len:523 (-),score=76.48 TRINITY_DN36645_c0_g1_i1:26-1594(-)
MGCGRALIGSRSAREMGESEGHEAAAPQTKTESVPTHRDPPPSANGWCYLDELPSALVVVICSYLSYEYQALQSYALLSSSFCQRLSDEMAWQHLCNDFWFVEEEHFAHWPKISSWKALYRTLEQWAVLQGFYSLPSAFPWCLLALLRFEKGSLVAEVVRFCQGRDENGNGIQHEVYIRLFEISFSEEAGDVHASITFPADSEGILSGRVANVEPLPAEVAGMLRIAEGFRHSEQVIPRWISAVRGLSIVLDGQNQDQQAQESQEYIEGLNCWGSDGLDDAGGAAALEEVTSRMVLTLLASAGSLPLALARSPVDYILDDLNAPHLRPGFYVGNYGHNFYGQFRNEVILVEFKKCTRDTVHTLFARPFVAGSQVPDELQIAMNQDGGDTFSFLVGTKITGDFHVPAGQTTFVALLAPTLAKQCLDENRTGTPREVRNRVTGVVEQVRSSWPGFGTLAFPMFQRASWAGGWLVRLQTDGGLDASADRFGFMWNRDQDMIVLDYIRAQTTSPFLNRKWLPEGLR